MCSTNDCRTGPRTAASTVNTTRHEYTKYIVPSNECVTNTWHVSNHINTNIGNRLTMNSNLTNDKSFKLFFSLQFLAPSMGLTINTSQPLACPLSNATQPIISYPVMTPHSILPHWNSTEWRSMLVWTVRNTDRMNWKCLLRNVRCPIPKYLLHNQDA